MQPEFVRSLCPFHETRVGCRSPVHATRTGLGGCVRFMQPELDWEGVSVSRNPNGLPDSSRRSQRSHDLRNDEIEFHCTPKAVPESYALTIGSTFYSLHHHLIFSTKERRPFIKGDWRPRLHEYTGGVVRGLG